MIHSGRQVLIIDDQPERLNELRVLFEFAGEQVITCARKELEMKGGEQLFAVVLIAQGTQGLSDFGLQRDLDNAAKNYPHVPVLVVADNQVHPLIAQQHDWRVVKQLHMPLCYPQIMDAIQHCDSFIKKQAQKKSATKKSSEPTSGFQLLIGDSCVIQEIRETMVQLADSDVNILILGESGTGKEVVARNLHALSKRSGEPFVALNCGAIPAELLESELFGHEKGAFTGAAMRRKGRFEAAAGGTLFLDEIGDMPMPMQVKLLRVLQEKTFERVGSNQLIQANARIITATHCNLEEAIAEGRFREDLFYRINVFPIEIPPLRERAEDISLLIQDIVRTLEQKHQRRMRLATSTVQALTNYHWPGNVRELANLLERLIVQYPNRIIDAAELPDKFRQGGQALSELLLSAPALPAGQFDLKEHLSQLESGYIRQALDDAEGVVARAAERLGMGRTTLVEKMRKYRIRRANLHSPDDFPSP